MVCEHQCFDRVRIVDLIAQAPAPAAQLAVGFEFHFFQVRRKDEAAEPAPLFSSLRSGALVVSGQGLHGLDVGSPEAKRITHCERLRRLTGK